MDQVLPLAETREIVASYPSRESFEGAVAALLAAGFDRTDLSVLGTHDSLAAAGRIAGYDPEPGASIEAGLAGEIGLLSSFTVAGVLLVMTGPVGVAAAALAGAAAGALAFRPFFDQLTESRHAAAFADAVTAGRILLWVRTADETRAETAEKTLTETGGGTLARLAKPAREAN